MVARFLVSTQATPGLGGSGLGTVPPSSISEGTNLSLMKIHRLSSQKKRENYSGRRHVSYVYQKRAHFCHLCRFYGEKSVQNLPKAHSVHVAWRSLPLAEACVPPGEHYLGQLPVTASIGRSFHRTPGWAAIKIPPPTTSRNIGTSTSVLFVFSLGSYTPTFATQRGIGHHSCKADLCLPLLTSCLPP
jgi:hypothetical protein